MKSGLTVTIVGEVTSKRSGQNKEDGTFYYNARVGYMGGEVPIYFESQKEFNDFPEEETEVVVQARGQIGKDGKLRLDRHKVRTVEEVEASGPRMAKAS